MPPFPWVAKYGMSTCQEISTRALQKLGIVGAGATPNAADNALALSALRAVYQKLITGGAFGRLFDVIPNTAMYQANERERIVHDGAVTVTLPLEIPYYRETDDYGHVTYTGDESYVRPPRDLSVISVVNTTTANSLDYIYDSRVRNWVEINALTGSSYAPLSQRDENGLTCLLAMNIADEFGQQPTQLMVKAAYEFQTALSHNWSQAGEVLQRPDYF